MKTQPIKLMGIYIFLIIGAIIMLYPYLWMVISTFKGAREFYSSGLSLLVKNPNIDVYIHLFSVPDYPIMQYLINSVVITFGTVFFTMLTGILAGYALGRRALPGRKPILFIFLGSMMLPAPALIIPLYFVAHHLHLLDTYPGITLALATFPLPFLIIYRFLKEVPRELEDAARIDGAGELRILWTILVPLASPAIFSAALLSFIWTWSAFITPYILSTTEKWYTLPVSLFHFNNMVDFRLQELLGAATIATIPVLIVFLVTQRRVFEGISGGVKG